MWLLDKFRAYRDRKRERENRRKYANTRNRDGNTPLHLAAMHGQAGNYRELLNLGADPYIMNHAGQTPTDLMREWVRKNG